MLQNTHTWQKPRESFCHCCLQSCGCLIPECWTGLSTAWCPCPRQRGVQRSPLSPPSSNHPALPLTGGGSAGGRGPTRGSGGSRSPSTARSHVTDQAPDVNVRQRLRRTGSSSEASLTRAEGAAGSPTRRPARPAAPLAHLGEQPRPERLHVHSGCLNERVDLVLLQRDSGAQSPPGPARRGPSGGHAARPPPSCAAALTVTVTSSSCRMRAE